MSVKYRVYPAAPFGRAYLVESVVLPMLAKSGLEPIGAWWQGATEQEELDDHKALQAAAQNDAAIAGADAVLAILYPGQGREMFEECATARLLGKPVIYALTPGAVWHLSAYRARCWRAETVEEGVDILRGLAEAMVRRGT